MIHNLIKTNDTLLEIRKSYSLSQEEAANILQVPVRTLRRYEKDENYSSSIKRHAFIACLNEYCKITEEKGLLSIDKIKESLTALFEEEYKGQINFCYLFGSYAKGNAKENSDIDLYISCSLSGLRFTGLIEKIRVTLNKRIDLIRDSELKDNVQLITEIMKWGIKIYG